MTNLMPKYPETLFRFRPYTPLSLKELQYGEIYFVPKDELNDPYDTKNPAFFEADAEVYKRFITWIFANLNLVGIKKEGINEIASFLAKRPLLQDELLDTIASTEFDNLVKKNLQRILLGELSSVFIERFKQTILNGGGLCYIASFSKINNDPVMWSHYANRHKGYCLCFSVGNGILERDRMFEKDHFFNECKFEEVKYNDKNVTTNGFMMLPGLIYRKEVSDEERKKYWAQRRESYLTKYSSWSYEQEVRIVIDDWFDVRSSNTGIIKKVIADRIFYYDLRQLSGIIFGAQMNQSEREEVRTIVYNARNKILIRDNVFFDGRSSGVYLPIFLFYQACENVNEFKMKIEPINGLDAVNNFFSIDKLEEKQKELYNLKELCRKQDEHRRSKDLKGPVGVNGTFLTNNGDK